MKTCPLCQKELSWRQEYANGALTPTITWECRTKAMNKSQLIEYFHYMEDENGRYLSITVFPYQLRIEPIDNLLNSWGGELVTSIYQWGKIEVPMRNSNGGSIYTHDWGWITDTTYIPPDTEENLMQRIKILIAFS